MQAALIPIKAIEWNIPVIQVFVTLYKLKTVDQIVLTVWLFIQMKAIV